MHKKRAVAAAAAAAGWADDFALHGSMCVCVCREWKGSLPNAESERESLCEFLESEISRARRAHTKDADAVRMPDAFRGLSGRS